MPNLQAQHHIGVDAKQGIYSDYLTTNIFNQVPVMKSKILAVGFCLALSACAYNQAPIVDRTGVNEEQYQQDLAYCESYALEINKEEAASVGASNGAAAGAGVGAVSGAFEDGLGGAAVGALVGALFGGATGAVEGSIYATKDQARVLRNCLASKGYKVYDQRL